MKDEVEGSVASVRVLLLKISNMPPALDCFCKAELRVHNAFWLPCGARSIDDQRERVR